MITGPKSVPSKSPGGDPHPHDHEIPFYNLSDLTNPIARCGSNISEKNNGDSALPWHHPFTHDTMQVAQVVEIKHYPKTIEKCCICVAIVIAFGLGPSASPNRSHQADDSRADPSVGDMSVRSRIHINPLDVVNFLTCGVDIHKKVDCIAIFATQNSDMASAIVITKVLFRNGVMCAGMDNKIYSNKAVSRGVSFMTLSRDHSDFEHLRVMLNQHGRSKGEAWSDWSRTKGAQTVGGNAVTAAGINGSIQSVAANHACDAGVAGALHPRCRVYYRGVQALAAPLIIDRTGNTPSAATSTPKAALISDVKRFEGKTFDTCLPEQEKTHAEGHGRPIQFIAYAVWNHYTIGLSLRTHMCMMDLEELGPGRFADKQWIALLRFPVHNLVVAPKAGYLF
ncbi:MAG: hypothetical protein J3R72DRAFT_419991 [Linnemannia gamsii]|nr:MAG: hypothetical protein J3R72DRAFT_419991 [Linnemannia gamsii]